MLSIWKNCSIDEIILLSQVGNGANPEQREVDPSIQVHPSHWIDATGSNLSLGVEVQSLVTAFLGFCLTW